MLAKIKNNEFVNDVLFLGVAMVTQVMGIHTAAIFV